MAAAGHEPGLDDPSHGEPPICSGRLLTDAPGSTPGNSRSTASGLMKRDAHSASILISSRHSIHSTSCDVLNATIARPQPPRERSPPAPDPRIAPCLPSSPHSRASVVVVAKKMRPRRLRGLLARIVSATSESVENEGAPAIKHSKGATNGAASVPYPIHHICLMSPHAYCRRPRRPPSPEYAPPGWQCLEHNDCHTPNQRVKPGEQAANADARHRSAETTSGNREHAEMSRPTSRCVQDGGHRVGTP